MAIYLNPVEHKIHTYNKCNLIFPFGGNASQFKAVENAMRNQISVIQGPPGTGKTQTILNIIANLLVDGKTVQIVSNNNSAIENVLEKLASPKYKMGFLVASLGNSFNKEVFVQNQTDYYPDLSSWKLEVDKQTKLREKILSHTEKLSNAFAKQERLAQIRLELDSILAIEVDGFHYHKTDMPQYKRDQMKNHVLELYGIRLLRFATNGSGEMAQIELALDEYEKRKTCESI